MKKNTKTLDELLTEEYGPVGTPKRDAFEAEAKEQVLDELVEETQRLGLGYEKEGGENGN